jgi:hypothetical protein
VDQHNQLSYGHQWLWKTFKVKPRHAWLIDPFGHSSSTPLWYSRAGFQGVVLNRVHYRLRERMAESKQLEFHWRPAWEHPDRGVEDFPSGLDDISLMAHVLPKGYYDVPNTCGRGRSPISLLSKSFVLSLLALP